MEPSQYDVVASSCIAAFRSIRTAKNIFMVLVVLALLVQLAGFILVDFVGVIDPIQEKQPGPTSRAAMEAAAEKSAERSEAAGRASYWDTFFEWTLPTDLQPCRSPLFVVLSDVSSDEVDPNTGAPFEDIYPGNNGGPNYPFDLSVTR